MHPTQDLAMSATPEVSRRNESARPGYERTPQRSAPCWLLIVLWIAATAGFTESLAARENTAAATAGFTESLAARKNTAAGRPGFRTVPQVGYTLRATQGTLSDSEWRSGHTFKWYRVDGDTETLVSGVTGDALTVVQSDLGKRFRVVFVFNGSGDERRSLKSPKTVRKEQRCSARVYRDWCTKMWAWERPIYSGGADSQIIGTYYGYLAIGAGIGVINDRSIEHGGETLNSIGEVGMAKYDDSQDKITLGLTAQRWLPDGTQFNIGGIRFSAHSGKTRVVGQYEWVRPSNLRIQRGQWVTVSARIRDSRLSVRDAEATEGTDQSLDFVVKLSPAASDTVTVDYATSDGTATAGMDYTADSGELTFLPDETTKTISVAITDDTVEDDGETMTLTLSNASGADLNDSTAVGTIRNTEEEPSDTLTAEFQRVPESHDGSNTFTFRVLLSQDIASGTKSKLWKALSRTGANLKQIRRVNNRLDLFEFTMEPTGDDDVTFSLGPSPTDCTAEDAVCTSDGTALSNAETGTVPGPADTPPTVSVTDASATEGAAVAFAVSLSEATSQQVTVQYATSGGTATSGTDFTAASNTLTLAANETAKTVRVATTDDSDDEDNEIFTLTLSSPTNATLGDATATGTINDNDEEEDVTPTVSVTDASATEGAAVAFAVSLSEATSQQVTVQYATSGGTATSGTDFTAASNTLTFAANETDKTVSVATTDDSDDEQNETFTLTLSSPTNATLGDATATGTINDNDEDDATQPLTASFESVPASHTGDAFTFDLTFSEDVEGLSHRTLRDAAFDVAGGSVKKAKRRTQGSSQDWTITVEPTSATEAVTITLPETTDCDATGAICTEDGRKLSNSQTATVNAASASAGDMSNGDPVTGALLVMKGTTPDEAAAALFGERSLSEDQLDALDRLGNRNGSYDLGDLLSWIDRCRRGEADCGGTSTDSGSVGGAALPAAAGGVGTSGRTGRGAPGPRKRRPARRARRRRSTAGYGLMMLLAATMTWSCADQVVGPAIPEPDPGFLTVELTAPAANRDIGVLLELEGPGIGAVRAPGFELYQSSAPERHQIVVAGSLRSGPLARFEVPDRNQLHLYRVHILQVTGEDYKLRDVGQYQAVISN